MKKYLLTLSMLLLSVNIFSQSATLSPYSMYGLGVIADQSNGAEKGMNGVGLAFRDGNRINSLNPASYSSVDSLTFIFDIGMSLRNTRYKEGAINRNVGTGDFEYAIAGFRAAKHLGVGFGILPYSNVGYTFSSPTDIKGFIQYPYDSDIKTTGTTSYSGSGGVREVFLGTGWEPVSNLSIGFNVSYLWGDITREVAGTFSDTSIRSTYKLYNINVHSYKLTFGAQYSYPLGKKDNITVGATYTPGHIINKEAVLNFVAANANSGITDTTRCVANDAYRIPTTMAIGVAYKHGNKWMIGADYTLQKWSSIKAVNYVNEMTGAVMKENTGSFNDRHKFALGGEWCKNSMGRRFTDRIRYRAGVSYTSSYLKINTMNGTSDGPKEFSASIGAGIPIINAYNNRSVLNIGVQWINLSGAPIKENTFCINIGLTFNEKWFAKWKFE